jgi:MscS family membrane protein
MHEAWISLTTTSPLGIPLLRWAAALVVLFVFVVAQRVVIRTYHRLTQALAGHTESRLDDLLFEAAEKPAYWLILLIGILATVHVLNPPKADFPLLGPIDHGVRIAAIVLTMWFLWRLIEGGAAHLTSHATRAESSLDLQIVPFLAKTLKAFLVVTGVLVIAQNLGYSISGLIASLGIGGIAVAMAARDTIANIFGSLMILIDRPFSIGHWIRTKDFEGVVEQIGFRSTRIRTFAKTLVNVPNSILANMVIDNIDAMPKRRVSMRIGLTYDTPPAKLAAAIEGIEDILKGHIGIDQEFSLVRFDEFADSSLSIFLYYFTKSTHWDEHLQVRQEVNLQIMALLDQLGLEFAFPTRTVHIQQDIAPRTTARRKA